MPSTFSASLAAEKQATGENDNEWGNHLNANMIDVFDAAIAGVLAFSLSGSKTLTRTNGTVSESTRAVLNVTGGTGGTITLPGVPKTYFVRNGASGDVILTTGSGATATLAAGDTVQIFTNGADVYRVMARNFGGQRAINLAAPVDGSDAATKAYADGLSFAASLPNQSSNAGRFLTTDGASASWAALGNSATRNVGTAAGTVAAGDDGRFASNAAAAAAAQSTANAAMPRAGGTFGGNIDVPVITTTRVAINNGPTKGTIVAASSTSTEPGAYEFYTSDGVRRGFLGASDGANILAFSENGWNWKFSQRPNFAGQTPYDTGNFNPALKANLASPVFSAKIGLGTAFEIQDNTTNYLMQFDTNDYIAFNRTTNLFEMVVGGSAKLSAGPSGVLLAGQTPYDTGNITYGTSAPGTLPVGAIYLQHA